MAYLRKIDTRPSQQHRKRVSKKDAFDDLLTSIFEQKARDDAMYLRSAEVILQNANNYTDPGEYSNALMSLNDLESNLSTGASKAVMNAYKMALNGSKKGAEADIFITNSIMDTEEKLNSIFEDGEYKTTDVLAILDNMKSVAKEYRPKANAKVQKGLDALLGNISDKVELMEMFTNVDQDPNEKGIQHYNQDIRSGWAHFLAGDLKRATTRLDAGKKKVSEDNWQKWEDKYTRDRASLDDILNKNIKEDTQKELYSDLKAILPTTKVGALHVDTLADEQSRLASALDKILEKSDIENTVAKSSYQKSGVPGFIASIASEASRNEIDITNPIEFSEWLSENHDFPGWDIKDDDSEKAGSEVMAGVIQSYLTLDNAWDELSSSSGVGASGYTSSGGTSGMFGD